MLRLVGFLALTLVVYLLLTQLPIIGSLAGTVPLLGFLLAAAIVSRLLTSWGNAALDRRREAALMRELGAVDTPYNKGKLGMLLLKQRRYGRAVPLLVAAAEDAPDSADWHYRLGIALLGDRQFTEAAVSLSRAVELDEEHAYGAAMMRLAEARQQAGDPAGALAVLQRLDGNHGPSPESAYRRGVALKALGRKSEAVQAFSEVGRLAAQAVGYQKREATGWSLRAAFARMF